MRTQDELTKLTRDVLGEDYVELSIGKYTLTEDIEEKTAWIVCQLHQVGHGPLSAVEGKGVGFIDALFSGLKQALVSHYPSIGHIHFIDFVVGGDFRAAKKSQGAHTDAPGHVRLTIENAAGREFLFETTSPSISASSVCVVVRAVEHFVNAELAVLRVYDWIEDARKRSRPDLADTYIQRLADLVQNASYSESIERRKSAVTP
ncbi:MAG: hypothetical protein KC635_20570 [Myxococcales bacterium]|nr:hypothetical protein [Myxococcales bacterium]MCB9736229.1 hypothetical protein [Deltaproteobacteria bacterium]